MIEKKSAKNGTDEDTEEVLFETSDTADEPEIEDIEEGLTDAVQKYKEKLKVCQKERQEYLDGWQRSKADYLNQKRRLEEERQNENERNAAQFVEKLLPLCDSFGLALANFEKYSDGKSEWRTGIKQIHDQLRTVLKSYNVEALAPLGQPFDPHLHEAVSEVPVTDPTQHHIILDVLQNGYTTGERLIRPAKVVVGNLTTHIK